VLLRVLLRCTLPDVDATGRYRRPTAECARTAEVCLTRGVRESGCGAPLRDSYTESDIRCRRHTLARPGQIVNSGGVDVELEHTRDASSDGLASHPVWRDQDRGLGLER